MLDLLLSLTLLFPFTSQDCDIVAETRLWSTRYQPCWFFSSFSAIISTLLDCFYFFSPSALEADFNRESLGLWGLPQPTRFSASRLALPVRWFLSSNLNEIQSAPYIHAHASWSQGRSVQQIDFPVHWTPLKKAEEYKSLMIYNGYTPESNQSVGSLPTASLLLAPSPLQLLIISLPSLAGY